MNYLFPEATCGFRRRDAVNYALKSGVGKTSSEADLPGKGANRADEAALELQKDSECDGCIRQRNSVWKRERPDPTVQPPLSSSRTVSVEGSRSRATGCREGAPGNSETTRTTA